MSKSEVVDACKACGKVLSKANSEGHKNGYDLLRCQNCQTVTISPFPSEAELVEFYQQYRGTGGYCVKGEKKINRATKRIKKMMKYGKGNRFLDVGCNAGFTVAAAIKLGLEAKGIDVDCDAVETAKKEYGENFFECLKVQDFAKNDYQFDLLQ